MRLLVLRLQSKAQELAAKSKAEARITQKHAELETSLQEKERKHSAQLKELHARLASEVQQNSGLREDSAARSKVSPSSPCPHHTRILT